MSFPQLHMLRAAPNHVHVIGHRGARGVMPENTLNGFRFARDAGDKIIELDVVMTADSVPVVYHNLALSHATVRDGAGNWVQDPEPAVGDLTLAQLAPFTVGCVNTDTAYGKLFADQVRLEDIAIPALSEVLAFACSPAYDDLFLIVELKADPKKMGDVAHISTMVAAVIDRIRQHQMQKRVVIHSFDWRLLMESRRQAPDIPISCLTELPQAGHLEDEDQTNSYLTHTAEDYGSLPAAVAAAGSMVWCPYFRDVTVELVEEAHDLGLIVLPWTVNDADDAKRLIKMQVDGLVTDYPGRMQHLIAANTVGDSR